MLNTVIHGDCLDVLKGMPDAVEGSMGKKPKAKLQYLIEGRWLDERDTTPAMRERATDEEKRHAFYCPCKECKGRVGIVVTW